MEEKINKVDDLHNIDEEADDEIYWWDLSVVKLNKHIPSWSWYGTTGSAPCTSG